MAKQKSTMEGMEVNEAFWNGKTVLLTGHTGFKGAWLSLWLEMLGAKVVGYSLLPITSPNLHELLRIHQSQINVYKDIRDIEALKHTFNKFKPNIVFHLAAQALVRKSYADPIDTYSTNISGLVNLLEVARNTDSVGAVINITSDKCYENMEWDWPYRECDKLGGFDPYSSSKACAEIITAAYRNSFFSKSITNKIVGVATARAGNVIGGGDWSDDRLMVDILKSINHNEDITIRYPQAIRPWQHVVEPLSGYIILAEKLFMEPNIYSGAWNFGPNERNFKSVEWIVKRMIKLSGSSISIKKDNNLNPHESTMLTLDCSKARINLGWSGKWGMNYSLEKILEWNNYFLKNKEIIGVMKAQITEYKNQSESNNQRIISNA